MKNDINKQIDYIEKDGINYPDLKASDPPRWVQEMNSCKQSAEEIVTRKILNK